MRWRDYRRSENIEDRRSDEGGLGGGGFGGGMGGFRVPVGGRGGIGLGGIIVLGLIGWIFLGNPLALLDLGGGSYVEQPQDRTASRNSGGTTGAPTDDIGQFVSAVLAQTEDAWTPIFRASGSTYEQPRLVLYRGGTSTACGFGQAAMGPFYCPGDKRVYLDTAFFDELARRFRAPGEFAAAYVVAHEVGHHVQNLIGILPKVNAERQRMSEVEANALQVRVELQADCFAGIYANRGKGELKILQEGDIEQALAAATAIGDDTLQRQATGRVVPDSFTHGTSAQRVRWFRTGFESGDPKSCDTFNARSL